MVVLIIGILAAIALPQYQKAVERSRMAEVIQVLGNFAQAQSIYYMQHNVFAEDIGELNEGDITLPAPGGAFEYEAESDDTITSLVARRSSGMYEDGLIGIGVFPDGSLLKLCQDPPEKTGFCTMAQAAGYQVEGAGGGGSVTCTGECGCDEYGNPFACATTQPLY